jgi:hypothetical protein
MLSSTACLIFFLALPSLPPADAAVTDIFVSPVSAVALVESTRFFILASRLHGKKKDEARRVQYKEQHVNARCFIQFSELDAAAELIKQKADDEMNAMYCQDESIAKIHIIII